jgi:peptidoglycan/xylan/chitin deacetylase (PgdA/CDA1 family)
MRLTLPTLSAAPLLLALATASVAGPLTTVPWNGRTGAVSFTYDDARTSQIPNLIPQLDSLGIKATFFISIQTIGNFSARRADWIQASRNGHELTNHTYAHANVNGSDGVAVTAMIKEMADTLRAVDASIQSVTFAYPNCNMTANATAKNGLSAENFMARGCANPTLSWGSQPTDWMNIPGEILGPTSASTAVSRINGAKTNNRWYVTIVHDVGENPDQYSMTPANNLTMLTAAVSAGVWIDTYSTIGAYYRAHFTIDTAAAIVNGTGWKVQWVSPHSKMPRSVKLRVKLDSTVFTGPILVTQGDTTIARQSDGSYIVDFMKLRLDVNPNNGTGVARARAFRYAPLRTRVTGRSVLLRGLPAGTYGFSLTDARGVVLERRSLRATGAETAFALNAAPRSGLYQLTLRPEYGAARTVSLLILQ